MLPDGCVNYKIIYGKKCRMVFVERMVDFLLAL